MAKDALSTECERATVFQLTEYSLPQFLVRSCALVRISLCHLMSYIYTHRLLICPVLVFLKISYLFLVFLFLRHKFCDEHRNVANFLIPQILNSAANSPFYSYFCPAFFFCFPTFFFCFPTFFQFFFLIFEVLVFPTVCKGVLDKLDTSRTRKHSLSLFQ